MSVGEIRSIAHVAADYELMQLALSKWNASSNLPDTPPTNGRLYTAHSQTSTPMGIAIWNKNHCAILSDINSEMPELLISDVLHLVEPGDTIVFFSEEDHKKFISADIPNNIKLILEEN